MSLPFHAGLHTLRPFALFLHLEAIGIHDHRLRSEAFLILPDIIDKLFGISGALNDLEDKKWITAV